MTPDVLLVGCGDLGSRIGLRLAERGHDVLALRRRAELVPPPLRGLSVDLTTETPQLPPLGLGHLVVALTARPRSEQAYRATYVEGLRRALDAMDAADAPARVLLEAERLFLDRLPHGTVLRCSGLYDGESRRLVDQVREGRVTDPGRWTNRIHRDDAAAAVVHLLTRAGHPEPVYLANDDAPASLGEVAAHIARRLGLPPPAAGEPAPHGKRISNARLRASGWTPSYPTFREGYADGPAVQ